MIINLCFRKVIHEAQLPETHQKSYLSDSEMKIDRWVDGVILSVEADISTWCFDVFVSQEEDIIDFDLKIQKNI